ncbi:MAG: TolC family protein [Candidatus Alcyoniella australis]|nr:TolC family protein [Candidatus Alcyoniella australis]
MHLPRNFVIVLFLISVLAVPQAFAQSASPDAEPTALTLAQAIEISLAHNLGLEGAQYQRQAARWAMWYSVAGYLPNASFNTSYTRLDPETVDNANQGVKRSGDMAEAFGIELNLEPSAFEDNYSSNITVVQPIFNGGAEIAAIRLARAASKQSDLAYDEQMLSTVRDTKTAYFQVMQASALKQVSQDGLALATETLRLFQAQYEVGQVSRSDVLRWEAQAAQAEGSMIEAESAYELSMIALAEVLGSDLATRYIMPKLELSIDPQLQQAVRAELDELSTSEQIDELIADHPAIKGIEQSVKMQCSNVQLAWATILPKLNFAYNYSWPTDDDLHLNGDESWTAMLQLEVPLFTGLRGVTGIGRERRNLHLARVEQQQFQRSFVQQVYAARLQLDTALRKLEAARKQVDFAEENLRNMQGRSEVGMASNLELLDAQVTYNGARSDLVRAVSDYYIALSLWEYIQARRY